MSQQPAADFNIDPTSTSGTDLAELLNRLNHALLSMRSGSARPPTAIAGTLWMDNSDLLLNKIMYFDGVNDVLIGTITLATGTLVIEGAIDPTTVLLKAGGTATGPIKGVTPVDAGDLTRKDYVDGKVSAHEGRKDNPHAVTAAQVGAPAGSWTFDGTDLRITL